MFRVALALALLAGFIAVLTRVKSFRFPLQRILPEGFRHRARCACWGCAFWRRRPRGCWGCRRRWARFCAGWRSGHSTLRPRGACARRRRCNRILLFTFFLSVGLLIDLNYVWQHFALVVLVLLAVAAGKTAINLAVLRLFRVEGDVAFRAALFLTPIGEFSFILAAAGASAGALSPEGYKLALSVIALSLLVSPIWFVGARRAQVLAQRGITGANALFRETYRGEIAVVAAWWSRASAAAGRARAARRARADAKKREAGAYDFPWDETKELPKPRLLALRQRVRHLHPGRVLVDDDLGIGIGGQHVGLHRIADLVRVGQAHGRVELDMQLDEGGDAGGAGSEIVQVAHLAMGHDDGLDAVALVIGQFAVHQLVVALAEDMPGAPRQDRGDDEADDRIGDPAGRTASTAPCPAPRRDWSARSPT